MSSLTHNQRWFLSTLLALFALALCGCSKRDVTSAPTAAATGRPATNLVLITVDALRADHLSSNGYVRETTPVLDRLAAEAVVFDNTVTPVPSTVPAHRSLLSGRYHPGRSTAGKLKRGKSKKKAKAKHKRKRQKRKNKRKRARGRGRPAPLARLLGQTGYQTAAIVSSDRVRGEAFRAGFHSVTRPEAPTQSASRTSERAIAWLKTETKQPYFLWLHYSDPAPPHQPAKRFMERFARRQNLVQHLRERGHPQPDAAQTLEQHAKYDAEVSLVDAQVGRVLSVLRELDHWYTTAVVVVGSTGYGLGQHGRMHASRLNNEQLLVPFLLKPPAISAISPQRRTDPASLVDVVPTLLNGLELVSASHKDRSWDGVNLLEKKRPARLVYSETAAIEALGPSEYAVTGLRWKLVHQPAGEDRLFDLQADRHELRNVLDAHPKVAKRLRRKLAKHQRDARARAKRKDKPGRFRPLRARARPAQEGTEAELFDRLHALGYAAGVQPAPEFEGVTRHVRGRAYAGYNLAVDGHAPEAVLMDMDGRPLHRWAYPREKAFAKARPGGFFRRAALLPGGELLAIYGSRRRGLVKLDADSNLVWKYAKPVHHDLDIAPDGTIVTLLSKVHRHPGYKSGRRIMEDFLVRLDANGKELERLSLLEAVENSDYAGLLDLAAVRGDIFHTNSVHILRGTFARRIRAFKKGNILTSMRRLNALAVVDFAQRKVVWAVTGLTRAQHDPSVVKGGRVLILDNKGDSGKTRVFEFDPLTREIGWNYSGQKHGLFTDACGAAVRLPNGNTLISETNAGRAIEVTKDQRIVWEYYTPNRAGKNQELIATLFEVVRVPKATDLSWLKKAEES